jgi:ATP-dependent Lhr-like helicase
MLDMLCLTGEVGWARLSNGATKSLVPATPVALFLREHTEDWQTIRMASPQPVDSLLTRDARIVLEWLTSRGASFFDELAAAVSFDPYRLRDALGVLVSAGLAVSDGFAGLRILVASAQGRHVAQRRRRNASGRWSAIVPAQHDAADRERAVEYQARVLLRRYGIVVRCLLVREPNAAPWRELARVYRRLEARGEIRGGRFVSGLTGEQFALPDAIPALREIRRNAQDAYGQLTVICTADPLNLAGIVTAGERVRAAGRNRMAYRDGIPIAVVERGILRALVPLDADETASVARLVSQSGHRFTRAAPPAAGVRSRNERDAVLGARG